MTDQLTTTPDDDPAVRAANAIHAWIGTDVHAAYQRQRFTAIIHVAYDLLIASVRELLGEILRIQSYGRVPTSLSEKVMLQQIADAVEVVRKERASAEEDANKLAELLRESDRWGSIYEDFQRQLTAANAEKRVAVEMYDAASQERRAANAENERLRSALERHLCKYDMADWLGCASDHGGSHCDVCIDAKPHSHQQELHCVDCGEQALSTAYICTACLLKRVAKSPDQERVEPDTLCYYQFITTSLSARIVGRCGVLRSKHGAVKDHAFVAEPPATQPIESPITTATCICGDPVHPSSVGVGLRHYSHGRYHLIEVRAGQEIKQPSEPEPDDPVEWLEDLIRQGSGAVILCMTENGDIGIFRDPADESAKALGAGDTIYDAADSAKRRAEAEPSSPQATAPVECPVIAFCDCGKQQVAAELVMAELMRRQKAQLVDLRAQMEREQAITANVIQSQWTQIRKLTATLVGPEVREKVAIQVLRAARELTAEGAVEAWRTLGQYWRNHWLMKADRIIAILAGEQEGRS